MLTNWKVTLITWTERTGGAGAVVDGIDGLFECHWCNRDGGTAVVSHVSSGVSIVLLDLSTGLHVISDTSPRRLCSDPPESARYRRFQ